MTHEGHPHHGHHGHGPHEHNSGDEERARLMAEARLLDQQLTALKSDLEKIATILIELEKAKTVIENTKKDNTVLVQIGAGSMVRAKLEDENILVPVGAGYIIKMDKGRAVKTIDEIKKKTKENHDKLLTKVKEVEGRLLDIMRRSRYIG